MKSIFLFVAIAIASAACAADVVFEWDYVAGEQVPSGFELRISQTSGGAPARVQDCPGSATRQCTVAVDKGNWFATCYAYAVDDAGKRYSGPSNEVAFQIVGNPNTPVKVRIKK